jgi:two-component system response regulator
VLVVEDNPDDAAMLARALRAQESMLDLRIVTDGEEALAVIHQLEPHTQSAVPDLVILDLNLPRRDGYEVLEILKSNPNSAALPVVILSSSTAAGDIGRAYRTHANAYITKPPDLDFSDVARAIATFWIETAKLPSWLAHTAR